VASDAYNLPARCRTTCRRPSSRGGFSLVEMLVATSILAVALVLTGTSVSLAFRAGKTTTVTGLARSRAEKLVQQIARDIRYSSSSSDGWDFPSEAQNTILSFSRCTGWDASLAQPTWGPVITYEWLSDDAAGEIEDGIDNNGNGVVDEGNLYRQRGNGPRVLIGRNVERGSLLFWREETENGEVITIRIGVAMPNPAHPDSVARGTYETEVCLRN